MNWKVFFGTLLSLVVLLICIELSLRLFISPQGAGENYHKRFVYFLNYFGESQLAPGIRKIKFSYEGEDKIYLHNSLDMRNTEEMPQPKTDEYRILILGGSFTYDIFQTQDKNWPLKLEMKLHSLGIKNAKVWNMGMPSTGSQYALHKTIYEISRYSPDMVIYAGVWNDIKYFHGQMPLSRVATQQTYRIKADLEEKVTRLFYKSWLLSAIRNQILSRRLVKASRREMSAVSSIALPQQPLDAPTKNGLQQYAITLQSWQSVVHSLGAIPVLLVEPNYFFAPTGQPNRIIKSYEKILTEKGIRASLIATRQINLSLANKQSPVFDFTPVFAGANKLLDDHIHLSEAGGDLMADLLSAKLLPFIKKSQGKKN